MRRNVRNLPDSLTTANVAQVDTPAGLASEPAATPESVVRVYGARCSGWLGYFGVHTWIAVKPRGATTHTVYEVMSSRFRRTGTALAIRQRVPHARWFGHTPELEVDLPPTAIGKDYLGRRLLAAAPSGSGFQVSLFGLLGVLVSGVEGLEINVLGLTFGIDALTPALKLPLIGRLGAARPENSAAPPGISADLPYDVVS
jgi:hypothetical protein